MMDQNPHKIRFDSHLEITNLNELKKMKDKNFHYYIFEEISVAPGTPGAGFGKSSIQNIYRPILDCENLAVFNEDD